MRKCLLLLVSLCAVGHAQDPSARGQQIIAEVERRAEGFGDLQAQAQMEISNGRGSKATRELRIAILELPGEASRSLTVVEEPKDVSGTALLTHTNEQGEDEQWLYLPALSRVKRIASSGRSGPFMGSEFSYEDFSAQSAEQFDFKWLRDEPLNGLPCHVLERRPKAGTQSAYGHQVIWLDQAELRLQQAEYHDQQGALIKTLKVSGYQRYQERYWRADELVMRNARTAAQTTLRWRDIEMQLGLSERDFDLNALKAAR